MQLRSKGMLLRLFLMCLAAFGQPASAQSSAIPWDTFSDTWVATDGLGRALPTASEVGPPRANRTVGMFYFLTFAQGGNGPYDNTQILKAHPEALQDVHNPAWGPLNSDHYWGEPLFGYYASDDAWVLRKHAQMLANAGVDVVVFDNSNAVTYDRARRTLCQVWEEIRRQGGKTPQIAFLCPFGNPGGIGSRTLGELYDALYAPGLYSDLWFRWNGKPLILAYPNYATEEAAQAVQRQPSELPSGETLGQVFTLSRPFTAAGGSFPTWATTGAGMTLSLFAEQAGPYTNTTGCNDIVAAKVSFDAGNVYFYVRTRSKLSPHTDPDWKRLYINSDADYHTGWLGYDFVVNRRVGDRTTSLERNIGGKMQWEPVGTVRYVVRGNEMEIAIPRASLGIRHLPATLDFKWADHCFRNGDWTDFTLYGDAAPDDRFNYRAILNSSKRGGN